MKYTTSVILFTAVACSAAMAASTESVSSSVIKCKSWEADCRIGTDYDKSEKDTSCKPRIDSTMACVDLCCKPLVAPTPSANPSSFVKCNEWNGKCRVGSEYDKNEKNTRCKDRTDSTVACVDLCCKPLVAPTSSAKPSSFVKCNEWNGKCRFGSEYDKNEKNTRCKDRTDSTEACVDLCCKPLVAPTPSAKPSSFVKCNEWNGKCRVGSEYDKNEKNTRCKDRTDSTEACVDLCCKPLVAPTSSAKPSSFVKCNEWNGKCRVGSEYDKNEKNTRCKDRTDSTEACVDLCCSQFFAPTPSAKPSIIICKDWEGKCRVGTDYDHKQKNTRCKDRSDSTMACVDECCTHE